MKKVGDLHILIGSIQMIVAGTAIGVVIGVTLTGHFSFNFNGDVANWFTAVGTLLLAFFAFQALNSYRDEHSLKKKTDILEKLIDLDLVTIARHAYITFLQTHNPANKLYKKMYESALEDLKTLEASELEVRAEWIAAEKELIKLEMWLGEDCDRFRELMNKYLFIPRTYWTLGAWIQNKEFTVVEHLASDRLNSHFTRFGANQDMLKWKEELSTESDKLEEVARIVHNKALAELQKAI